MLQDVKILESYKDALLDIPRFEECHRQSGPRGHRHDWHTRRADVPFVTSQKAEFQCSTVELMMMMMMKLMISIICLLDMIKG